MNRKEDLPAILLAILREKQSILLHHTPMRYYNELLDGASSILAALLEALLHEQDEEWAGAKWVDDSLLTQVSVDGDVVCIAGMMIWGRGGATEQWVDPFFFEISLADHSDYKCWLGDEKAEEVTYRYYSLHRERYERPADEIEWKMFFSNK